MQRRIRSGLVPLAVRLYVEIAEPQDLLLHPRRRLDVVLADKRGERRVLARKHYIELADLVTNHPVRTLQTPADGFHVLIDAANHLARAGQIAAPVLRMRGLQRRTVLVDEGLVDALNVSANRGAVGRAIVVGPNAAS